MVVLQKPLLSLYPPATLTAWYYAVGSALTILVCACYGVQPGDFLLTGKREVRAVLRDFVGARPSSLLLPLLLFLLLPLLLLLLVLVLLLLLLLLLPLLLLRLLLLLSVLALLLPSPPL